MMWSEEHSFLQFFPFWYVCQALGKKSDPLKKNTQTTKPNSAEEDTTNRQSKYYLNF